jgi:isopentenyl-diphosphate delta-isomerase type 1
VAHIKVNYHHVIIDKNKKIGKKMLTNTIKNKRVAKFITPVHTFSSSLLDEIRVKYNIKDSSLTRYIEEQVILVDSDDKPIGSKSLLESHLNLMIKSENLTHRAFSLLLFDEEFNLLVQRRSLKKLAFPGTWGNSCCSHPLFNNEKENQEEGSLGVRLAAERRSYQELNFKVEHDNIIPVAKIYYREYGDEYFGESEIDHILFATVKGIRPDLLP